MTKLIDCLWLIALWPFIFVGGIANSYLKIPTIWFGDFNFTPLELAVIGGKYYLADLSTKEKVDTVFQYYQSELPEDYDCGDVENKRKNLHYYRKAV